MRRYFVRQTYAVFLLPLLVYSADAATQAETDSETPDDIIKVFAEGFSPGSGSQSRLNALHDAERQALEIWLLATIGDVDPAPLRALFDTREPYVYATKPIAFNRVEGGVRASANVFLREQPLRRAVANVLFATLPRQPRIVILIDEQIVGGPPHSVFDVGVAETTLYQAFSETAFGLVAPEEIRQGYTEGEMRARLRGDLYLVGRFGREMEADVVIVGNAIAKLVTEPDGTPTLNAPDAFRLQTPRRVRGELNLRVVRASDGELFATIESEAALNSAVLEEGGEFALRDAAYRAREEAIVAAALACVQLDTDPFVSVKIENPAGRFFVEAVMQKLRGYAGVGEIELLRMTRQMAFLHFPYEGGIGDLARFIEGEYPQRFSLEPVRVVGSEMVFRLVRPEPVRQGQVD